LLFWRRPPQSNCPPGSVPDPGHGPRLDFQNMQGGISTLAQLNPEAQLQSLPPILRRTSRKSLPSCSKGSWGLSVLPRVEGIFTPDTISLSPWSRQRGCCYAIRAGRNFVFIHGFPWHRLYLHLTRATEIAPNESVRAGVLCIRGDASRGSQSLSRYGDRQQSTILPSVLPAMLLQAPG